MDVGNSAVKAGLFDGREIVAAFPVAIEATARDDAEAWTTALRQALHEAAGSADADVGADGEHAVERAGLVSVVPAAIPAATEALHRLTGAPVTTVTTDGPLPFRLAYDTPDTLGTDRLAAAAAAWVLYGRDAAPSAAGAAASRSVLAVDAGTAVTVEVIARDGVYRGGTIGPGPALARSALRHGTAQLPEVPLSVPDDPVGRSTQHALQSGIMFGFIDGVRGLIDRLAATLPDEPVVVATGGWRSVLAAHLDRLDHVAPHLVLQGVRVLTDLSARDDA